MVNKFACWHNGDREGKSKEVKIMKPFHLIFGLAIGLISSTSITTVFGQQMPPPNISSGMYQSSGHIYKWNNETKTTCHVVNPTQHSVFRKKGIPQHNGNFYPHNYKGSCLWPQGVYEPPGEGKAFFITSKKEICHIPTSALHKMLANHYGVNESSSFNIISAGLNNIGICPTLEW